MIPDLYDLYDLYDPYDLYDLYDVAHGAGWEPHALSIIGRVMQHATCFVAFCVSNPFDYVLIVA